MSLLGEPTPLRPPAAPPFDTEPAAPEPPNVSEPSPSEWIQMLHSTPAPASSHAVRTAVKEVLETVLYIVLVFIIVRSVVQNFKIEGASMEPTLHSGQYVLVNKIVYFHFDLNAPLRLLPGNQDLEPRVIYPFHMPQRGDIIVFEYPLNVQKDFIKRVIALPGETIEIRDGRVYVNNLLLDEPYLHGASTFCNGGSACSVGPVTVPPDTIFVMGDNRLNSSDSREWDALPLHRVIGQAWVLYFPLSDFGLVPTPEYTAPLP